MGSNICAKEKSASGRDRVFSNHACKLPNHTPRVYHPLHVKWTKIHSTPGRIWKVDRHHPGKPENINHSAPLQKKNDRNSRNIFRTHPVCTMCVCGFIKVRIAATAGKYAGWQKVSCKILSLRNLSMLQGMDTIFSIPKFVSIVLDRSTKACPQFLSWKINTMKYNENIQMLL